MSQIYVLSTPEKARKMVADIKARAGAAAASGRPLVAEISEYDPQRSGDQNRFYWQMLTEIAEQVEIEGRRFSKEAWHEEFREQFLPKIESPSGLLVPISTTSMKKKPFADYCTQVSAYAVQTLGVEFAAI